MKTMNETTSSAFELLERPIQNALWDMQWRELRPIQIDAIHQIIRTREDLIISARTASGKTEAAFLPILSELFRKPAGSIQAIYVGPLKALINDQFRRLEELCERAEIAVHRWHGDVAGSKKKKLLADPNGVLLITPESLESIFVNHSNRLSSLFSNLEFVVIDEIHALVGTERGTHLRSLLYRMHRHCQTNPFRIVGLSATLGNAFPIYKNWIRPDEDNEVSLINDLGERKEVQFKIYGYVGKEEDDQSEKEQIQGEEQSTVGEDCFRHMAGKKNLIFANSKQTVEWFADSLNGTCRSEGMPEQFLVHHGSLSKEVREFAESEMRGRRPLTIVCSSTLELGIDIGNVSSVGQLGPTWSVNSQVQRLGRSGRGEGEAQRMRVYIVEEKTDEKTPLVDRLRTKLLQAIATTELMLEKPQWVEPPYIAKMDFSTLTQQILSIITECGGVDAKTLFARTAGSGAFRDVGKDNFVRLIRSLAENDLIEQMPQGDLILGPTGESIVDHYTFYSAFFSSIEYSVVFGSEKIGMLPAKSLPRCGDHFLLAGRRWLVVEIDDNQKQVVVKRGSGRKATKFLGNGGDIHPRVRQMMKKTLVCDKTYSYLSSGAAELLEEARFAARRAGLDRCDWVSLGPSECQWFTWTSTKAQRTLRLMLERHRIEVTDDDIALKFSISVEEAMKVVPRIVSQQHDARVLAELFRAKWQRKFDQYVSEDLLNQAIAHDFLDVEIAQQALQSTTKHRSLNL